MVILLIYTADDQLVAHWEKDVRIIISRRRHERRGRTLQSSHPERQGFFRVTGSVDMSELKGEKWGKGIKGGNKTI